MANDVTLQMGHYGRTTGATGTSGIYGTEQQYGWNLAHLAQTVLEAAGYRARVTDADAPIPPAHVFLAIHQDGSDNADARGASVGYPDQAQNRAMAEVFKQAYPSPGGFRPDNYTPALAGYYAFRRTASPIKLLCEFGFATNNQDDRWMWSDVGMNAAAEAILAVVAAACPASLDISEGETMKLVRDPLLERAWLVWIDDGQTMVREYQEPAAVALAGDPIPNVGYIIDQQVAAGTMFVAP